MNQQLVEISAELLRSGKAAFIIGYAEDKFKRVKPFIAHKAEEAELLIFNDHSVNNLSVYLTRLPKPDNGKIAIVAKGCDIRSILALIQESQLKREDVIIIGVNCNGVVNSIEGSFSKNNTAVKCKYCKDRTPHHYDYLVGDLTDLELPDDNNLLLMQEIDKMSPDQRWSFWQAEFEKCLKCYACRQVCPLCYCEQCIADKTTPRWIESSATSRGNLAWNIIRAFHLSGRCIGCNECERVCPVSIPLSLLNRKMGMVAMKEFNYRHGTDPDQETLIGNYNSDDKETFIM